jgi:4-amino-4-deoxy-L-arabinose transferase-like glycosyltransferase
MVLSQNRAKLADFLFVGALMLYVLAGIAPTPIHGDEFMQMAMARDVFYLARGQMDQLRFNPPVQPDTEQQLRLINGPLNKDLIGGLWIASDRTDASLPGIFAWAMPLDWNQAHGNVPAIGELDLARLPSAILTALGVILIFVIGQFIGGRKAAYPAALLYALDPAILLNGRRAMMEGGLLACTLLLVAVVIWLTCRNRKHVLDPVAWVVFGLSAGITLAAKHTGIIPVAAMLAAALWNAWQIPRLGIKRGLIGVVGAGAIAGLVFFAFNPTYWTDPIGAGQAALDARSALLAMQTRNDPNTYSNVVQRIEAVLTQPFLDPPQYYEAPTWQGVIDTSIQTYEASPTSGWRWPSVVGFFLTLSGWLGAALAAIRAIRDADPMARVLIFWFSASLVGALIIPIAWQRYYLPWILPMVVLAAYAPGVLIAELTRASNRRAARTPVLS